jgi:hypothetical protein
MSKGLGWLQRAILATLEARPGGDMLTDCCGTCAWLADGTHDLRAVSREMAGSHCRYATESWQASFSRAIAGLADRCALNVLWLVPLEAVEHEFAWPSVELAGGLYLQWFSRQRRFVGNRPDFLTLREAYTSEYNPASLY